jgi:cysteinyl-tRNA synthetase
VQVNLRLHDTATRTVREFCPLVPGRVSIYLCGATVQAPPHIGHLRSGISFDILVRWLRASGYDVTFCRNVTDIDDKILQVAEQEGIPWWAVAERNLRAFTHGYEALGCVPPEVEPRATGHVPEMIAMIRRLIEREHAYPAAGGVYFDVHSYPGYGELSGQRLDQMGTRAAGLAPRVLGHGPQIPGRKLRHSRRRPGSGVPAPRERDRAVSFRRIRIR